MEPPILLAKKDQNQEIILPLQSLKSGPIKYKLKDVEKVKRKLLKLDSKKGSTSQEIPQEGSSWISKLDLQAYVVYITGESKLYFKVPDIEAIKKQKCSRFKMLECANLSAADLKVTSKFGSWNTMNCRLLVESNTSILSWTRCDVEESTSSVENNHLLQEMNCRMVKVVLDLAYLDPMRNVLHSLKLQRLKEQQDKSAGPCPLAKIREGLPEWVNFIPYQWYCATLRKTMEYIFLIYTILSLLWAVWQLYKHVDFIRASLRPLVQLIEYYLAIMKNFMHWLDRVLSIFSDYWWTYMKPIYMIISAAILPFTSAFKPIISILPGLLDPFIQFFMVFYQFLKPVITPIVAVSSLIFRSLRTSFSSISTGLKMVLDSPTAAIIIERCNQFTIFKVIHEALHGKFDPLKSQLFVVQTVVTRSLKAVFVGLRFLFSRLYYLILFVKRERDYAKEEAPQSPLLTDPNENTKSKTE